MCVCRVFALSQYLCTASGQRTRHLVTFPEVSLLAEKYFFDKQKDGCRFSATVFLFWHQLATATVVAATASVITAATIGA